jgi:tRNA (cmo5U34)-methyltransferase
MNERESHGVAACFLSQRSFVPPMAHPEPPLGFDEQHAATYDERFAKIAAIRDALHLQLRAVLSGLPERARILCVGAGTGAELIMLATHFPQWQFTAVEPSAPMMTICQRHADEHGFADRCVFHLGYLDSLPVGELYHAATSLLVSHFITNRPARRSFFRQIATRLQPRGWLVTADLSGDQSTPEHARLEEVWFRLMAFTGQTDEQRTAMSAAHRKHVAFLPLRKFETLVASAGFEAPTLFYQALLIHAWFTQRHAD